MSRRHRAEKREVVPDPKYNNVEVTKFIQKIMISGKKSLALKIVYGAIEEFAKRIKSENPLEVFLKALENAMPQVEVKSRRIGGATYQVPVEIPTKRKNSLAMKWIITHARKKPGRSMAAALALELQDCYNGQGSTIKKRDDTHRMAEANKAFAHYRW